MLLLQLGQQVLHVCGSFWIHSEVLEQLLHPSSQVLYCGSIVIEGRCLLLRSNPKFQQLRIQRMCSGVHHIQALRPCYPAKPEGILDVNRDWRPRASWFTSLARVLQWLATIHLETGEVGAWQPLALGIARIEIVERRKPLVCWRLLQIDSVVNKLHFVDCDSSNVQILQHLGLRGLRRVNAKVRIDKVLQTRANQLSGLQAETVNIEGNAVGRQLRGEQAIDGLDLPARVLRPSMVEELSI
mmetsp:Transcript_62191/g.148367  ORF Transcript_62191/g.148367 Transcript_62191/m.148367 type:complete len:242 (-) Transcript_62191:1141-1866(-)